MCPLSTMIYLQRMRQIVCHNKRFIFDTDGLLNRYRKRNTLTRKCGKKRRRLRLKKSDIDGDNIRTSKRMIILVSLLSMRIPNKDT